MRHPFIAVFLTILITLAGPGLAVQPDEVLPDPAQESRARALSAEIRCLVCQNQSIDNSDASLARDLRLLVREQIKAGKTDQGIRDFLVARYGDFVLLKPPIKASTWLLWFGPLIVLVFGLIGLIVFFRTRTAGGTTAPATHLDADEQARVERLLDDMSQTPDNDGKDDKA
jgi:cytochrome c-type biogenesis protein CcmH